MLVEGLFTNFLAALLPGSNNVLGAAVTIWAFAAFFALRWCWRRFAAGKFVPVTAAKILLAGFLIPISLAASLAGVLAIGKIIEPKSLLAKESYLGFSAELMLEIRNVPELRRQYIFQHVTPETAKADFYFSADDHFVFSISDVRGETYSLEIPTGILGIPIYRQFFLVCEAGTLENQTILRVLVDGREVAERTFAFRVDLGSRNWSKATMGANIDGKQNSAFTVLSWGFGHVTMTDKQIDDMRDGLLTYIQAVQHGT